MGKKVKRKGRTPQKDKRVSISNSKNESEPTNQSVETVDGEVSGVKERKPCAHLDKGVDLNALSAKIGSSETIRCDDCREGTVDRRGGKGKGGKAGKRKGGASGDLKSDSRAIWVCLACGHYACGGVGLPTSAQCHALRHARQTRHPLVVQLEKPQLRWCFPCNTLIQAEMVEENGEQKDVFLSALKLIKGNSAQGSAMNVEEVCLGTGSVTTEIKSVISASNDLDGRDGYVVRGLANLGNTCFFNSVLQNLLAMDKLRDYFLKLDVTIGPLTMTLKKLFIETQPEAGLKNVLNPRAFFGCVCSKAPQFRGYQQHDGHELLRCLLDGWSSEELGMRKRINSSKENDGTSLSQIPTFVDTVFGGQVSSTVCCTECGHSSTVYEPYLDLSLPVPTKRLTSKKANQSTRSKKPKLPQKRAVKNRPKNNRPVSDASTSKELPCQSDFRSAGQTAQAEENFSVAQNSLAIKESENKEEVADLAEQISFPLDDFTWMDYLEPEAPSDDYDFAANNVVDSILQEPEAEHSPLVNDVPLLSGTESEGKNPMVSYVPSKSSSELEDKNTASNNVPVQTGTEAGIQVLPLNKEPDTEPQFSSVNPWEDEIPLLVQNSDILLLPYKDEASSSAVFGEGEASSAIQDGSQEDFDGFGGLFDEPEVSIGPVAGPSMSNDVSESGFIATNSSESDPDEVDHSDSPVSVETCLTHFTMPELLSDENAWNCENCSKTLLRQKLDASKLVKAKSEVLVNGCQTETQSDIASVNKNPFSAEVRNDDIQSVADSNEFDLTINCSSQDDAVKENGKMDEPVSSVSRGKEVNFETKDKVQEESNSSGAYFTCREESSSDQATVSGCGKLSSAGSITNRDQEGESKMLTTNHESKGSEDGEINSETIKVKSDATKRVLINKAPPVLTIHLKRFSQDARGRLSKLNGHVAFRETVDLKPYMNSRCIHDERCDYRLIGIVEHQGTMRGGHYVAYVRGKTEKGSDGGSVWFHASDAYVRETNLEEVLRCEAYILFYEKV